MIQKNLIPILVFIVQFAWSQNLVPNPSFERSVFVEHGIYNYNYFDSTQVSCWVIPNSSRFGYINNPLIQTGDLFWPLSLGEDLPARTGEAKIGIHQIIGDPYNPQDSSQDTRSYIQTKLIAPLIAGKSYTFKMYVTAIYYSGNSFCPITSAKNLGVHFSVSRPTDFGNFQRLNVVPQINFLGIEPYSLPRSWVELKGTYIAFGGERYITIGNFDFAIDTKYQNGSPSSLPPLEPGCNNTQAHISIDDVSLVPLGSDDSSSPTFNIGKDTTICGPVNLTLTASPGFDYYQWSDGSKNQTIHITAPGTYWCRTDEFCTFCSDTIKITQIPLKTINLGNDTSFCGNGTFSIPLNAGNGFTTYEWSTGQSSSSIIATKSGKYWVKATYSCGIVTDTIVIQEILRPKPVIAVDTVICLNSPSFRLKVDGANLRWYDSFVATKGDTIPPLIKTDSLASYTFLLHKRLTVVKAAKSHSKHLLLHPLSL